jgi:RNA polymerase sigma-70 factor (ECF subfamily)
VVVTFEEVYARFRTPVWRLARRMTGSEAEALDATQEIFVRVWRGLGGFRGEARLSTWVFQIAWNYLRWYRRRAGAEPTLVSVEGAGEEFPRPSLADTRPDPERRASAIQLLDRVEAAIDALPEHYRVVVWLRDAEDLSYEQIATVLDLPIGTVRSRLARARASLKRTVDGGDG